MSPMAAPPPAARVPEPALVRSALVTITGIIALILGHAIDTGWIDVLVNTYAGLAPLIAGFFIRPVVTPWPPGRGRGD